MEEEKFDRMIPSQMEEKSFPDGMIHPNRR
jgi:hypothetical protein